MFRRPSSAGNARAARHRGLTLVELLVAISVLGLVAVLGWRGLDSIVRTRIALNSDLEQTRGMQLTFAQMQSDCAHLADASTLLGRTALSIGPDRISLVRTVFADDQPSRLQVITYQVKDGVLSRRESAPTRDLRELDSAWLATEKDTDISPAVVLQSDVAEMKMRFWADSSNGWRTDFNVLAQPQYTGLTVSTLQPTGLEVTLQLRGHATDMLKIFLLGAG